MASAEPDAATGARAVAVGGQFDVAVIGAGVFGAWSAYRLQKDGRRVIVLDAFGPGNTRASSGGESRIIRMGYGADELYTHWSMRSLDLWLDFCHEANDASLLRQTGILWMARHRDRLTLETQATLLKLGVRHRTLSRKELEALYPQFDLGPISWAILEPDSGVLMSRRAVQSVLRAAVGSGAKYRSDAVQAPAAHGRLDAITLCSGDSVRADTFIFACGPWLPKLFPSLLQDRILVTRQEVLFFGAPFGDRRFEPPAMPAWIDFGDDVYGVPDLEGRGFKIASRRHGPVFDPDTGERMASSRGVEEMRLYLGQRFPAMKQAPLIESRVCQYETTQSRDFIIDRHPDMENVWIVGGGSSHGFKHGPAVAEYISQQLDGTRPPEPRFALATKQRFPPERADAMPGPPAASSR